MFLHRVSRQLLTANTVFSVKTLRCLNIAFGRFETEIIDKWKQKFASENVSEIENSIKYILEHVIEQKETLTERKNDQKITLTKEQLNRFEQLCECRMARMPVQYIIGEWDFCDLELKMRPPVFICRPESEELVELILQQCDDKLTMRFLEVGCGSGAISLALLHSLPKAQCIAIDQSGYACNLTLENATNLELNGRIKILKHKLTNESEIPEVEGKLDLIVSNPPYVPTNDLKVLAPEISLYEDLRALDGGPDGLNIIRYILTFASKRLKLQGHLWLEVDPSHPPLIEEYLQENKSNLNLKFVAAYKDMFGKDRFVEIMKI
ncbi:MTRF1L release factor glutamine methyltransferase [Sitodiplosis mosellana]|uniref:MTRF1L release factor glutamine methyltransferase n=1 Tax=Sitodiplosis mosellana TaxID=263140 RepID=UPI002444D6B3|nr:MTRF1L release factor glutamine methyltransferase [Sitodiplosis mosellana]